MTQSSLKQRRREDDKNADAEIAQVRRALDAMESVPADVRLMFSAALRDAVDAARPADRHDTQTRMLTMIGNSFCKEELRLKDAVQAAEVAIIAGGSAKVETETKLRDVMADLMAQNVVGKEQKKILKTAFSQRVDNARAALKSAQIEMKHMMKEWESKLTTSEEEWRVYCESLDFLKKRAGSTKGVEQATRSDKAACCLLGSEGSKKSAELEVAKRHVKAVVEVLKKADLDNILLVELPTALLKRTEERRVFDKHLWIAVEVTFKQRKAQADEELYGGHRAREVCNAAKQKVRDYEDAIVAAQKEWKDHDAEVARRVAKRDALVDAFKSTRKEIDTVDRMVEAAVLQGAEAETALTSFQEAARTFEGLCERGPAQRTVDVTCIEGPTSSGPASGPALVDVTNIERPSVANLVVTDSNAVLEAEFFKNGGSELIAQRRAEALERRKMVKMRKLAEAKDKAFFVNLPPGLWNAPTVEPSDAVPPCWDKIAPHMWNGPLRSNDVVGDSALGRVIKESGMSEGCPSACSGCRQ